MSSTAAALVGATVELHGLQARPELNGRAGVAGRFNAPAGRYVNDGSGPFEIKEANLRVP